MMQARQIRPWRLVAGFAVMVMAAIFSVSAHPDLIEQIVQVTEQMNQRGASVDLFCQRAELFRRHGQFDAALTDLTAAERLQTNAPPLTLERARICCDAGRAQEAFASIQSFLQSEPQHCEGLLIRARARARLGQAEEAVADYNAAIRGSSAPTPDMYLERARLQTSLDRLADAANGLDEATSNAPFASPLQLAAIEYDRQRGAFNSALTRVDGLVARYPVKEPWLTLRAEVLEQAGQTNEARQTFERVLAGVEAYSTVRRTLDLTKQLEQRARQGLMRITASRN